MSMPKFPNPDCILTRDQAINAILTSIAQEEAALSHIINAEGEKIQYVLQNINSKNCHDDMDKILEVNESVSDLIEQITDMQLILKSKMRLAAKILALDKTEMPSKPIKTCSPKKERSF
jgi:hypothetical protein